MKLAALLSVATVLHALPGFCLPTPAAQTQDDAQVPPQDSGNNGGPISRYGQPLFNIASMLSLAYLFNQNRRLKNRHDAHVKSEDARLGQLKSDISDPYHAVMRENRQLLGLVGAQRVIRVANDDLPEPLRNHVKMKACLLGKLGHGGVPISSAYVTRAEMNAKILECAKDVGMGDDGVAWRGWLYTSEPNKLVHYASDVVRDAPALDPPPPQQQEQDQRASDRANEAGTGNMLFSKVDGETLRRMAVQSFQSGRAPGFPGLSGFPGIPVPRGRGRVLTPPLAIPGGIRLH